MNVSSVAARLGSAGEYVDYAASKGALDTMTLGLARETAEEGIRVNAVRPGFIYTEMHASGGEPDRVERHPPILHTLDQKPGQPAGELDYDAEFRASFDFCIASVHSHFELDRAAQTARVVSAMRDPSVRMIGHLTARMIGGRPPIALDLEAVLAEAAATGTALEVNGALPRLDPPLDALRLSRGRDVRFVLTSDAHHTRELALVDYAALHAERAWLDPSQVVNTWPADRLRSWCRDPGTMTASS